MEKINHRELRGTLGSRVSRRVGTKTSNLKGRKERVKTTMKRLVKEKLAELNGGVA